MGAWVRWILRPLLDNQEAWLLLNVLYFSVALLGAIFSFLNPSPQKALLSGVREALSPGSSLGPLVDAYRGGHLVSAALLTFAVNLLAGSLLFITVPSLVVPFAGVLAGFYRAALWGIMFSPACAALAPVMAPHLVTILVEGEAYVVAMLGALLWWWPVFTARGRRWEQWQRGLKLQARLYVAIAFLLALGATYEALEIVYLIPSLR